MIFQDGKLLLIAGPCSLECRELSFRVAERVAAVAEKFADSLTVLFKGSFDKANRTSLSSPRGPGIDEGLKILADVRKTFGLPTSTNPPSARKSAKSATPSKFPHSSAVRPTCLWRRQKRANA